MKKHILAIDQGTTSSRAILFDPTTGTILAQHQQAFPQHFPQDGWVEHDGEDIWQTCLSCCQQIIKQFSVDNIKAIGIANQRETTLLWDKKTGKLLHRAIVWQDRRTNKLCQQLRDNHLEKSVQAKTGLLLDPYFSASKLQWLLDNIPGARKQAEKGELVFGTVDCFLLWRLTEGKRHVTDATNASRTLLFNIDQQQWDDELLEIFNIPRSVLPEVLDNVADFGTTALFGKPIPICGVAGDQQAAAIGQACFHAGMVKSTYGTGAFMLANTGNKRLHSQHRLLSTVAYRLKNETCYALEGSIFIAGAAIQWLRDGLKIISSAKETETLVAQTEDNHGVYFVPALTGLGAPYWQADARGAIVGLTRDSQASHIVRAALEAVAYQTRDVLTAMQNDGLSLSSVRVDGGMVNNNWFSQFLADILNVTVARPQITETTALGAAILAGLGAGLYSSLDDISKQWHCERLFQVNMNDKQRQQLYADWGRAVNKVLCE